MHITKRGTLVPLFFLAIIENLRYAILMVKKRYILLFFLAFVSFGNVFAAPQNSQPSSSQLTVNVGQFSENISQDLLNSWSSHVSTLKLDNSYRAEFENTHICPSIIVCSLEIPSTQRNHIRYSSTVKVNKEAISSYVNDLSQKVNHGPTDAKFQIENGKVSNFLAAEDGVTLKNNEAEDVLVAAVEKYSSTDKQTVSLPFDSKKPDVNYKDINDMGISSLIGEGTSNFRGSPVNRIKNIKVAIRQFNGILIKPGEDFSFVKALGEVDESHGYFPELVIKGDKTEPDFGGGICQVSTTMFRAALNSGLKITARRNHAYPVSYYNPQGMDATVYVPQPDLKFTNNTPNYILVQVRIEGTQLFFDFYGTDDGRKTTIEGPTVTEKQPDGSMKTTFTQHVFNKDGNEFIKDVFNSNYDSPYRHPHPGGPVLSAKPSNWTDEEWKSYKKMVKEMAKAAASQAAAAKNN